MNVRLLSKKQMASELGVSNRTIERWDSIGYIQCIRIGGRVYFSYTEVVRIRDRFLEEHQRDSRVRYAGDIASKYLNRLGERR